MKVTYDKEAKAMYVHIFNAPVHNTEELIPDSVMVDKTVAGQICGIEILNVELVEE